MIHYALKCAEGHGFDSWFASAAGFEELRDAGRLSCPHCGATGVDRAVMAPSLSSTREGDAEARTALPAAAADDPKAARLKALREAVEANSEYVGLRFAEEARAMHDGGRPNRPIHGEARLEEARKLIEDGVPVMPLPFRPKRKLN